MNELTNKKNGKRVGAQHGEAFLRPVDTIPAGETTKHKLLVVAHSETGHHHVLESETEFEVMGDADKESLYLRLFEPAKLVHKKSFDIHETETIVPGDYKVYYKKEYSPWEKVMRRVFD